VQVFKTADCKRTLSFYNQVNEKLLAHSDSDPAVNICDDNGNSSVNALFSSKWPPTYKLCG